MPSGLKSIEKAIDEFKKTVAGPGTASEAAHQKVLLNFLDGLKDQIRAFCFTWTGNEVYDDPPKNP